MERLLSLVSDRKNMRVIALLTLGAQVFSTFQAINA
jgi:hypothetical protein